MEVDVEFGLTGGREGFLEKVGDFGGGEGLEDKEVWNS